MFIDSSAVVSILAEEPGFEDLARRIDEHPGRRFISPLVRYESAASLARMESGSKKKPSPQQFEMAEKAVEILCEALSIEEIDVTPEIGREAMRAAQRYGKIVGHKADLNFGDIFSYGAAKVLDMALVYKGNDFVQTDLA